LDELAVKVSILSERRACIRRYLAVWNARVLRWIFFAGKSEKHFFREFFPFLTEVMTGWSRWRI